MLDQAKLKKHAGLFDRMAGRLGLDLEEEAIAGRLHFDEISEAVLRCSHCARPGQCAQLLQAEGAAADGAPDYCRNRDLLEFLKEARP